MNEYWLLQRDALVDQFRVIRPIGRGGMGEVYLARDTKLGRKVALKIIGPHRQLSASDIKRFLHEARATARFSHPHIVTIYAVGELEGRPYLALEYLEGVSLKERLGGKPLKLPEVFRITLAIAEAIREAHAHQILHRDLKPDNVMLAKDGRLRVVDFGVAVFDDDVETSVTGGMTQMTKEADAQCHIGTPPYMAPEQWGSGEVCKATDIWALGVMLYEMVAGARPFPQQEVGGIVAAVCSEGPAPRLVRDEAPELVELVAACLEKQTQDRPTAAEVVARVNQMLVPQRHTEADRCPFQGLLAFTERHSEFYFGRDDEIGVVIERMRQEPVLTVIGASGAGKSSFVQAGIIARLREQQPLLVVQVRPGAQPFDTLARRLLSASRAETLRTGKQDPYCDQLAALLKQTPHLLTLQLQKLAAEHDQDVLLYVDQLEELCTLVDDEDERRRYMEAICLAADDAGAPVRALFTLREEFLSRLSGGHSAREAFRHVVVLHTPGPEVLERILLRQAAVLGYRYDDEDLVRDMVADVLGEPSALSLLQFAGRKLWNQRDRTERVLRRSAYEEMGGVAGALAKHASGVIDGMPRDEQQLARSLLLRLLTSEGTRRVVSYEQLLEGLGERAAAVLGQLTTARLLTVRRSAVAPPMDPSDSIADYEEALVELAHESLAETWSQLRRWLADVREERQYLTEVEQAAQLWQRRGCRDDALWEADALADAARIAARSTTGVPDVVSRFIEAGQRKQRRARFRRRVLLAVAFFSLALVAVGFAIKERQTHQQKERGELLRAEAYREAARAALASGDLLESRARLRGALEITDSAAARLLWWRTTTNPAVWRTHLGTFFYTLSHLPDGKVIAAAGQDRLVYLLDAVTGRLQRVLRGHGAEIQSMAHDGTGQWVYSGSRDGGIWAWNVKAGRGQRLQKLSGGVHKLCLSKGGLLAAAASDGTLQLVEVAGGKIRAKMAAHEGRATAVACSPDGRLVASGGTDKMVRVWEVATKRRLLEFSGHSHRVFAVAFSPDGRSLASAGTDRTIRIWGIKRRSSRVLVGHLASISELCFTPDGGKLVSSGVDGELRVWSMASGQTVQNLRGHKGAVYRVQCGSDGKHVSSTGADRSVRLWDLDRRGFRPTTGDDGPVIGVAFSPDGKQLATGHHSGTVRIWDVALGHSISTLSGHSREVYGVAFSPDGKLLATGSSDRTIRLWDLSNKQTRRVFAGHEAGVMSVTFSFDGKLLASSGRDRTVRIWDVAGKRPSRQLRGHEYVVPDIAFSPDGKLIASASIDKTLRIWSVERGTADQVLRQEAGLHGVAYDPRGGRVAVGDLEGNVWLWDLSSERRQLVGRHDQRVHYLAFGPSGQSIASPSADHTTRLWNLRDSTSIVLEGHTGEVNGARFNPAGTLVASGADDGTVRVWRTDGRPYWRGPALLSSPVMLYSHRGWQRLDGATGRVEAHRGWQRAIAERAVQVAEAGSRRICLASFSGTLEMWNRSADELLWSTQSGPIKQLIGTDTACIVLTSRGVFRFDSAGKQQAIAGPGATAIVAEGNEALIAKGREINILPAGGKQQKRLLQGDIGVTAMARSKRWILLGYRDGNIDRYERRTSKRVPLAFEGVSSAPVTVMRFGRMGTLFVGFGDGLLGVWSLKSGKRLGHEQLHGSVTHLLLAGRDLYAATDLGDYRRWRLDALHADRCTLLCDIWRQVPVLWEGGKAQVKTPPQQHVCQPCNHSKEER